MKPIKNIHLNTEYGSVVRYLKNKEQKEFLMKLKNEISSFLVNYKKKYQRFPWSQVNKVSKIKLYSSTPMTVNGSKFTVKELVKVMNMTKKKINGKLKPSSYNYILKAYIRDSYNQSGSNLKSIYNSYHTELQKVFKEMDYDLMFCLNGLKELNKTLKSNQRKSVKESEDINMNNDELLLALIESDLGFEDDDVFEEGVNKDIRSELNSLKRDYKMLIRSCKDHLKENDFKKAKRDIRVLKNTTDKIESRVKELDSTSADVALGLATELVKNMAVSLLIYTAGVKIVDNSTDEYLRKIDENFHNMMDENDKIEKNVEIGNGEQVRKALKEMEKNKKKYEKELESSKEYKKIDFGNKLIVSGISLATIQTIISLTKNIAISLKRAKKEGGLSPDNVNIYKNKVLDCIRKIKKEIDKLEKDIEKAEKSAKSVKESEDINMNNDELLLALIESDLGFEDDDVFEESVNTDIKDEFKKLKSEYKALSKKYDQNLKEGNFEEARRNVKLMSKVVDRTESTIKDLKGGVDTAVLGFVLNNLKQIVISLLIRLGSKVVIKNEANKLVKSGVWSVGDNDTVNINVNKLKDNFGSTLGSAIKVRLSCRAKSIQNINDTLKVIVDTIGIVQRAKKDGELSIDTFNVYKNKVLFCVKNIKDDVRSLEKEIDEAEKKAVKSVKESEDIKMNNDELLLALIESELGFEDDDIFEEKANENIKEKYNEAVKEFNELGRKCRILTRENKFVYAEKCLDKMQKIIAEAKNDVKESKSDALDIILPSAAGFLKACLGALAEGFIVSLVVVDVKANIKAGKNKGRYEAPVFEKKAFMISAAVMGVRKAVIEIISILKETKELDVKGVERLNKCKVAILKQFVIAEKTIEDLKTALKEKKKYIAKLEIDLEVEESEYIKMYNDELLLTMIESELGFEDDDIFEEGVNKDITSEFKKLQAEYRALSKKCKENIKDGKFADARRNAKLMAKVVDRTEANIKELKGDAGTAVIGIIMSNLKMMVGGLLVLGGSIYTDSRLKKDLDKKDEALNKYVDDEAMVASVGGNKEVDDFKKGYEKLYDASKKVEKKRDILKKSTIAVVSARATLQLIIDTTKIIKRAKEEGQLTADTFNVYKSNALTCVKRLKKDIVALEKEIDKAEREVKAIKESYDEYDEEVLALIESEMADYEDDDIFEEAANDDVAETIKKLGEDYKKLSKECKEKIDKEDFAGARKKLKEMKEVVEKAKKSVSDIEPDKCKSALRQISAILQSFLIGLTLNATASILVKGVSNSPNYKIDIYNKSITKKGTNIKKIPGETKKAAKEYVGGIKKYGKYSNFARDAKYTALGTGLGVIILGIIDAIKSGKVNESTFNVYRTRIVDTFKIVEKEISKLEKDIDKAEKAIKAMKESYDEEYDNELLSIIAESYLEDEFEDDVVTEGANLESRKIFIAAKKEYKKLLKEYKKNVKSANFKEARKNVKDIKVVLVKASKALDSEKGGVNSAILGNMAVFMKDFMVGFSAALPGSVGMGFTSVLAMKGKTITPVIGGISVGAYYIGLIVSAVYGAKATIKDVVSIINAIKQEKNVTADVFNRYRLRLSQKMDDLIDATEKMNKHIDEVESAYKEAVKTKNQKEKVAKESAEFDAEKLAIYESCHRGEITVEEREELLSELEDKKYVNEAIEVEESVVTNYEKLGKVAEVLYERCANGEITVEDRENLLAKAKEMIL